MKDDENRLKMAEQTEIETVELLIPSGQSLTPTFRGNFIHYDDGQGVLFITTNEGRTIRMKRGDDFYFPQPYAGLTIRSTYANDSIRIDVGFGVKKALGREIGQRLSVVDSNNAQQDVRSVDGRSVDVVSEPSKYNVSEAVGALVQSVYLNAETQAVALRLDAMAVQSNTNYLQVLLYYAGNNAGPAGYPARVYDMADRTWSESGRIFKPGHYLIDTRGASLMELDAANIDASDLPFTQILSLLNFTNANLPLPAVQAANVTGIAGPGQFFIAGPSVAGRRICILGYRIEARADAVVAGGASGTFAFMYDPGSGLINTPFAHDFFISDAPAVPDYSTIRRPLVFDVKLPEGGWVCPSDSGIIFDTPVTLTAGTIAVTLFYRDA